MITETTTISSVYGPVESWRLGKSLGIDLLMDPSSCSFNCTYCQLGFIQNITSVRKIYVPTKKVLSDFENSNWQEADVITFSGNGEPTLALNIGEVIKGIKQITSKPIVILTNGTLFNDTLVREAVLNADIISAKLDSPDDKTLETINRPAVGININLILSGVKKLKNDIEKYKLKTKLQIQIMFMPQNINQIEKLAVLLNKIKPDEIALNTPTRPYPSGPDIITRGAHCEDVSRIKYPTKPLKRLTVEQANEIENKLKELTGIKVVSVYEKELRLGDES